MEAADSYRNSKIDLGLYTTGQREYIQRALFSIGYSWAGSKKIKPFDGQYLYITDAGLLHGSYLSDFMNHYCVKLSRQKVQELIQLGYSLVVAERTQPPASHPKQEPVEIDGFLQYLNNLKR